MTASSPVARWASLAPHLHAALRIVAGLETRGAPGALDLHDDRPAHDAVHVVHLHVHVAGPGARRQQHRDHRTLQASSHSPPSRPSRGSP